MTDYPAGPLTPRGTRGRTSGAHAPRLALAVALACAVVAGGLGWAWQVRQEDRAHDQAAVACQQALEEARAAQAGLGQARADADGVASEAATSRDLSGKTVSALSDAMERASGLEPLPTCSGDTGELARTTAALKAAAMEQAGAASALQDAAARVEEALLTGAVKALDSAVSEGTRALSTLESSLGGAQAGVTDAAVLQAAEDARAALAADIKAASSIDRRDRSALEQATDSVLEATRAAASAQTLVEQAVAARPEGADSVPA